MTKAKRITYLDMARGIGMLLVVMGHVEYIDINIRFFVTAFHMPLFFLISGVLMDEKEEEKQNLKELILRKLRRIMLPYAIFSALSFFIEGARIAIKGLDQWDVVFRQLFQSLCLQGVSTLWFLPALFICEIVFVIIRKKTSHGVTVASVSVLVLVCVLLSGWENNYYQLHAASLGWSLIHDVLSMLLRNFFCAGFLCMGYYLNKIVLKKGMKIWQEILAVICLVMVTIIAASWNPGVDLRYMRLHFFPIYVIEVLAGTMSVILFCRLLAKIPCRPMQSVLEYYGRNSLIIMVTHMDFRVLYTSIKAATIIYAALPNQILFCFLIVVFVFIIEIPIIWVINRYIPIIVGKPYKIS